ncbi:MAG TPA: polysaccharide deacetylase family protein [Nitrososphaeraceae archaeon]|nr:polysaccharide deacetylase family protein [Nitrososphaeraceae archaeon]
MNRSLSIGIAFLLFGVGSLVVVHNNVISSNIAYGEKKEKDGSNERNHLEKFFEDNYQENKDYSEENPYEFVSISLSNSTHKKEGADDNKYVIIVFDRGYKTTFLTAKPILDKYGFKASIFVLCEYVEKRRGLNWDQIRELHNDGYDIQSHGLEHKKLTEIKSPTEIESIIGGGKKCLEEKGFSPTAFQVPFNEVGDNHLIVDTIAKYFDFAFIGHSELMFLNCDGWENFGYDKKNYYGTTDCRPYSSDGTFTLTNKFAMKEWSHDRAHHHTFKELKGDAFGKEVSFALFEKFVQIVNSQTKYNKNGDINAIPIVGYHAISRGNVDFTHPELFDLEMKYLYDNGFKVITLEDLGYDEKQERFYIKNVDNIGSELSQFQNKSK